eukprot:m.24674 g.24674  ORF g.24674 m.24674 type:complete len:212 (+) comp7630_c0_seq1:188-823(+)
MQNPSIEEEFLAAAQVGQVDKVLHFQQQNDVDVNYAGGLDDSTALILASGGGHKEVVLALLDSIHVHVNAKNKYGQTALILASNNGHTHIVEILLNARDININATNNHGDTALIRACPRGHTAIVSLLLATKGLDINIANKDGNNALILAGANGQHEAVLQLLEMQGIDVNHKNYVTALKYDSVLYVMFIFFVCRMETLFWTMQKQDQSVT